MKRQNQERRFPLHVHISVLFSLLLLGSGVLIGLFNYYQTTQVILSSSSQLFNQFREEVEADRERIFGLFPILKARHKQKAGTFSGGEQQMLAVGRALMSKPKVLMMDEPSLGLAPIIVGMIFDIIRQINAAGVTVLLVEQNAKAALDVADTGYVMETGAISFSGHGKDLLADDRVRKAYLGA